MQRNVFKSFLLIVGSLLLLQIMACQKDQFITSSGAGLQFSTDTLAFDTVFTNLGNATRRFKVYNPHDQIIRINRAYLAGGSQSDFKINIDGAVGPNAADIEIPAKDSIYIFATVFIDPNNGDAFRTDSIMFETDGGGLQRVVLDAYGWNATYIENTVFKNQTVTLTTVRPYIFRGIVAFDSSSCLIIPSGVEIYMYGGPYSRFQDRGMIYIGHNSCIRSNVGGNLNNPVEIKTHRLEEDYQAIPFHHSGIVLSKTSKDNIIHGTIIRNAVDGIFADSFSTNGTYKVEINNCKIFNTERAGVLARGSHIKMTNTVIANSNQYCFIGLRGGQYNVRHCTFINVGTGLVSRSEAVLSLRDYEIQIINNTETAVYDVHPSESYFTNCIIYGNKNEEVEVLTVPNSVAPQGFSYEFTNCLMKLDTFSQNLTNCLSNQDPLFVDEDNYDYQIDSTGSPANNAGTPASIPFGTFAGPGQDIIGQSRHPNTPAIGAYAIPN